MSFQDENSCQQCQVLKRCQEKQVLKSVLWFGNWTVTLLKTVDGRGEEVENRMHQIVKYEQEEKMWRLCS